MLFQVVRLLQVLDDKKSRNNYRGIAPSIHDQRINPSIGRHFIWMTWWSASQHICSCQRDTQITLEIKHSKQNVTHKQQEHDMSLPTKQNILMLEKYKIQQQNHGHLLNNNILAVISGASTTSTTHTHAWL